MHTEMHVFDKYLKKNTEYCKNSIFPNRMGEWKDWQA